MKKESRFSSLIECYKSGFNPYQILGLTPDCTDEDIMKLWLKFKGEHISQEVMKSFYILLTPSNRFVYDELMKHDPNKDNFSDKYVYNLALNHIEKIMRDEIYQTKTDIKEELKFARNRLAMDDPRTISNQINHIARFVRNNEGHWIYSKDATRQGSNNIVDIYKRKDKYFYYICESNFEYIIEARDLFYNLNKKTRYDGKRGNVDSVACRIKDNLVGYYTEINTIEPNNLSKYEYFKNTIGTVYHSRYEEWQAILKITDLRVNRIFLPSQIEFHSTTALVILENMVDTYIEGKKTTEEDENRFLADVAKTNPDDKHELKRIISHQYPL